MVVTELPANTTEYHDTVTQACWRVVAVGEGGRSGFSNPVCVVNGEIEVGGSCNYVNVKTVEGIISDLFSSGKISGTEANEILFSLFGDPQKCEGEICGLYGSGIENEYEEKFSMIAEINKYRKIYYSSATTFPAEMEIDDPEYYSSIWWRCEDNENCGDYFSEDNILFKWLGAKLDLKDFPDYSDSFATLGIDPEDYFLVVVVMKGDKLFEYSCHVDPWGQSFLNVVTYVDPDKKVLHIVADKFSSFYTIISLLTFCTSISYNPPYAIVGFVIPKKYMDYRIELETSDTAEFAESVK